MARHAAQEFNEIYDKYAKMLYGYALHLCGDPVTADDIVQTAFLKAIEHVDSFEGKCGVSTWLCQIAKNIWYDMCRKSERNNASIEHMLEQQGEAVFYDSCKQPDLLLKLVQSEESACLYKKIHLLPEPYKEVFLLRVLGCLSFKDIRFYNRSQYVIQLRTGEIPMELVKEGTGEDSLEYQVTDINRYLDYYLYSCFGERIENRLLNGRISAQNAETLESNASLDGAWFAYYLTEDCMKPGVEKEGAGCTEYSQRTGQQIYEILKKCQSNRFQMTDQQYNEEEKKFNATLFWEITDLDGKKCSMTKAFYFGPSGYEPVDDTETVCAGEGFDQDLIKKMKAVFD